MQNRSNNPCSFCCSLVILVGISVLLVRWDVTVIQEWSENLEGTDYLGQVWLLVTCLLITYLWFSIPFVLLVIGCGCIAPAKYIGYSLIILFGPNLLEHNRLCVRYHQVQGLLYQERLQYRCYGDSPQSVHLAFPLHLVFDLELCGV